MRIIELFIVFLLPITAGISSGLHHIEEEEYIREASGIARSRDNLLIVSDDIPGAYFVVPVSVLKGVITEITPGMFSRLDLFGGEMASDLESIDILADGRIVAVSEDRCELYGQHGIVARYPAFFMETGNRGFEGLAIRQLEDGSSEIAVLWEGGFPISELLEDRHKHLDNIAMPIVVFLHTLAKGAVDLKPDGELIALENPSPSDDKKNGERFRAPDFVWHEYEINGKKDWGWIVLMQSQSSENNKSSYHCLHLYDTRGHVIARHDLGEVFKKYDVQDQKWEGLDWFEEGKSLLLVNDNYDGDNPKVLLIDLPEGW